MQYDISICIPTYNKAKYLDFALDSIVKQLDDTIKNKIEICISDNASTDNTIRVIENYKSIHHHITYFRQNENKGYDFNLLKSVEIASGKYCWLLGSDDAIIDGAISEILSQISLSESDIYSFNMAECDENMNPTGIELKMFKINRLKGVLDFSLQGEFEKFSKAATGYGMFGVLNGIVRKEKWDAVKNSDESIGTSYIQVYYFLAMIADKAVLAYINKAFVMHRGGSVSSFENRSRRERLLLDINGYKIAAKNAFAEKSDKYNIINEFLLSEIVFYSILDVKIKNRFNISYSARIFALCLKNFSGYFIFWARIMPLLLIPGIALKFLVKIYRLIKKKWKI
ncbi:MAG: glycosyltransferase [Endomicrobium sp.]|nr:glycosyltransferase [Endomicrobium sp.]